MSFPTDPSLPRLITQEIPCKIAYEKPFGEDMVCYGIFYDDPVFSPDAYAYMQHGIYEVSTNHLSTTQIPVADYDEVVPYEEDDSSPLPSWSVLETNRTPIWINFQKDEPGQPSPLPEVTLVGVVTDYDASGSIEVTTQFEDGAPDTEFTYNIFLSLINNWHPLTEA